MSQRALTKTIRLPKDGDRAGRYHYVFKRVDLFERVRRSDISDWSSGYGVELVYGHQVGIVLVGRHRCVLSRLHCGSSAFDDASVASHDEPHHDAHHSPRVLLRTQDNCRQRVSTLERGRACRKRPSGGRWATTGPPHFQNLFEWFQPFGKNLLPHQSESAARFSARSILEVQAQAVRNIVLVNVVHIRDRFTPNGLCNHVFDVVKPNVRVQPGSSGILA